jgi:hypothetical protein
MRVLCLLTCGYARALASRAVTRLMLPRSTTCQDKRSTQTRLYHARVSDIRDKDTKNSPTITLNIGTGSVGEKSLI